jgi:hypothetical protein
MPHRDDLEAAQQRADALERELREARAQVATLKGEVPRPSPSRANGVFVALGVVVTFGVGAMALLAWQVHDQSEREARIEAQRRAQDALEAARLAEISRREREAVEARMRAREARGAADAGDRATTGAAAR